MTTNKTECDEEYFIELIENEKFSDAYYYIKNLQKITPSIRLNTMNFAKERGNLEIYDLLNKKHSDIILSSKLIYYIVGVYMDFFNGEQEHTYHKKHGCFV